MALLSLQDPFVGGIIDAYFKSVDVQTLTVAGRPIVPSQSLQDVQSLQALVAALTARVAALESYIRELDSAIEIVGVQWTPPN